MYIKGSNLEVAHDLDFTIIMLNADTFLRLIQGVYF